MSARHKRLEIERGVKRETEAQRDGERETEAQRGRERHQIHRHKQKDKQT